MNNIIGELLSKIMGGCLSWRFHLKDSSPIQTNYFLNHHKPFKQGLSFMILWLTEMHTGADVIGCDGGIVPMLVRSVHCDVFRVARSPNLVSPLTRG